MKAPALALLLFVLGLAQAAAQPFVRVEIKPSQRVTVGQQVRVGVTVLAPNFFLSPPQFPMFDIPGAVVVLPDERALNSTETVNGETYAGISRDYLITPRHAGDFALPPAEIAFSYAAEPGKPGVAGSVRLPPQRFTVELPQGAKASTSLVTEIVVTQTVEGDPKSMKVGDALTRTVETFAPNTQAMMIPPPTFIAPPGVRAYPRDPVLTDVISERGAFVGGRRVDQATYVFEQKGAYSLPAIEVRWYNTQSKRGEVSAAPEINVSVAEAPPPPSDLAPPSPTDDSMTDEAAGRIDWRRPLYAAVGLAVLVIGGYWMFRPLAARAGNWARARRQAREMSEAAAFARLSQACRSNDATAAYSALGLWARRQGAKSVESLCGEASGLREEVTRLERCLYGRAPAQAPWSGRALLANVKIARASRRAIDRQLQRRLPALPALNPW